MDALRGTGGSRGEAGGGFALPTLMGRFTPLCRLASEPVTFTLAVVRTALRLKGKCITVKEPAKIGCKMEPYLGSRRKVYRIYTCNFLHHHALARFIQFTQSKLFVQKKTRDIREMKE